MKILGLSGWKLVKLLFQYVVISVASSFLLCVLTNNKQYTDFIFGAVFVYLSLILATLFVEFLELTEPKDGDGV